MATKRKENGQTSQPELPPVLAHVVAEGQKLLLPHPSPEEESGISELFELMSPRLIHDPRWSGQGTAPLVLREPLLLVSWDRRAGAWKVSISDKVLNVAGSCLVPSLLDLVGMTNALIVAGKISWSQKKIRAK
jgi:hypothetical protein